MEKSYNHFNNWVLQRYLIRNVPRHQGTLCFDESDWKESGYEGLCFPVIIEKDWSWFLRTDPLYNIPLYFGLIALQCYAATLVEDNKLIDKFLDIVGLDSKNDFQKKCQEYMGKGWAVQEYIWESAKLFFAENYEIKIVIPKPKDYKDRYIQYPKSQAILNQDDLKEYIDPFFLGLSKKYGEESISFELFKRELNRNDQTFKRLKNKREWSDKEKKIKSLQIFNFYNSDRWYDYSLNVREVSKSQPLLIVYDEVCNTIKHFDSRGKECKLGKNLFNDEHDFLLFKQHEIFEDEFYNCTILEGGHLYILLGWKHKLRYLKGGKEVGVDNIYNGYSYRLMTAEELLENTHLKLYLQSSKTIKIEGIRINRRNEFFRDLGPQIINKDSQPYKVFLDGNPIMYNPYSCVPGNYCIRKAGYTNIYFTVKDPFERFYNNESEITTGILIDTLELKQEGKRLIGLRFVPEQLEKGSLTINNWILALNKGENVSKSIKRNSFFKLLGNHGC